MFSLLVTGCGKKPNDEDDEGPSKPSKGSAKVAAAKASLTPVKATEYGTITGKITWTGKEPDLTAMTATLRKEMKTDRDYCLKGKDYETTEQSFRIGKNKCLGNVFVWIVPEEGHYFEIPADQSDKFKTPVQIHQPHFAFFPHAAVLFPSYYKDGKQQPTGQKRLVINDATVNHNSRVQGGTINPLQDRTISAGHEELYSLKPDKSPISVVCGVHGWMRAYLKAFDHPYAAVSSVGANREKKEFENDESPAFGTYEIKGVPVGAKVRIIAWHESLGISLPAASKARRSRSRRTTSSPSTLSCRNGRCTKKAKGKRGNDSRLAFRLLWYPEGWISPEHPEEPAGKYRLMIWHEEAGWVIINRKDLKDRGKVIGINAVGTTDVGKIALTPPRD